MTQTSISKTACSHFKFAFELLNTADNILNCISIGGGDA